MDVEEALQWAFGAELRKTRRRPRNGLASSSASLLQAASLGIAIRPKGWHAVDPFDGPHPDALLLLQAAKDIDVVALMNKAAVPALDYDLAGFGHDVESIVGVCATRASEIVLVNALRGSRPLWGSECRPEPVRNTHGQVEVLRTDWQIVPGAFRNYEVPWEVPCPPAKGGRYMSGAFCRLRWVPDPTLILRERAEYLIWWCALKSIATHYRRKLTWFLLVGPRVPQMPWLPRHARTRRLYRTVSG
jgi:hypothetical protein